MAEAALLDPPSSAPPTKVGTPATSSAPEAPIKGAIDLSVAAKTHALDDTRERALQPGSSRNKAFDELDKRAGVKKEATKSDEPKSKAPKIDAPKSDDSQIDDGTSEIGNDDSKSKLGEGEDGVPLDAPKPDATASTKPDSKKPNPWRLADEWKKKAQEAEKRVEELKSASPVEHPEFKTLKETLAQKEKREKELVDELRYFNFEKHDPDFKANFDAPYKAAWIAAVEEISQFPVTTEEGTRAANADDLLRLVNLPPVQARELAEELFGKYADDVLMERKRVREKFDARARALDQAKRGLGETQAAKQKAQETAQREHSEQIAKLWESSKKFAVDHPQYGEYFKPREGDQEGNLRLSKGFELVERAMNEDPNDPNLTPQQRADIIKRHAFVFHRAAGFGRVVSENKALKAKLAAIEKELGDFKASEPGEGRGTKSRDGQSAPASGLEGAFAELDRRAKGQR